MAGRFGTARGDAYDAVFTALSHPARRRILMTLHFEGGSMTSGAIAGMFRSAWPTTTRHLAVLGAAGLVSRRARGRERTYVLERSRFELVRDWLAWFSKVPG
jgi:DNA-binding transcriptional ArsR family regulator